MKKKNTLSPEPQPTEKKLTPEQELEFLFYYKGNIDLINKIKKFSTENIEFDKYEFKKGVTQKHVINVVSLGLLNNIVFPILETVYIFQDKPFKCLGWIKEKLKQYETNCAEFLKSLVLDGLKDRGRFETVSNHLEYIIQEISEYDCADLPNEPRITCGMFEYFTGEKEYSEVNRLINAFAAVRGLLKTKQDIVKDFIKDNRNEIIEQLRNEISPLQKAIPLQQAETKTIKLKVPQIALIHVYEGVQITRDNAGEIAANYGYTSKNSGEGLFQDYTTYCSMANRKGKPAPCTPKKLTNKINLFESVVNYLSDKNKKKAIDEIKILKTIFESEYQ